MRLKHNENIRMCNDILPIDSNMYCIKIVNMQFRLNNRKEREKAKQQRKKKQREIMTLN